VRYPDENRCDLCGRFMKQHWAQGNDEPDSWYDYWTCQPKCMAEWRRQNEEIENRLAVETFNRTTPIGSPVRYWTGARVGGGRVSVTRSEAQILSGHTPVVWVEGHSGCIALTHVDAETAVVLEPNEP
jgi:hypothetical protein